MRLEHANLSVGSIEAMLRFLQAAFVRVVAADVRPWRAILPQAAVFS